MWSPSAGMPVAWQLSVARKALVPRRTVVFTWEQPTRHRTLRLRCRTRNEAVGVGRGLWWPRRTSTSDHVRRGGALEIAGVRLSDRQRVLRRREDSSFRSLEGEGRSPTALLRQGFRVRRWRRVNFLTPLRRPTESDLGESGSPACAGTPLLVLLRHAHRDVVLRYRRALPRRVVLGIALRISSPRA